MDKISIVVPCYNEEDVILIFFKEIVKVIKKLPKVSFELIFINDGSSDKTLSIIKNLAKENKFVKYISFSRNFGKEAAIYAGLKESNGNYVTLLDVDLQDPPEMIIEMYNYLKEDNDLDCVALKADKHTDYGFVRKFFTNCYYKIIMK